MSSNHVLSLSVILYYTWQYALSRTGRAVGLFAAMPHTRLNTLLHSVTPSEQHQATGPFQLPSDAKGLQSCIWPWPRPYTPHDCTLSSSISLHSAIWLLLLQGKAESLSVGGDSQTHLRAVQYVSSAMCWGLQCDGGGRNFYPSYFLFFQLRLC